MVDYTTFVRNDGSKQGTGGRRPAGQKQDLGFWWMAEKNEAHEAVFAVVKAIEEQQASRVHANMLHLLLYGDKDLMPLTPRAAGGSALNRSSADRITFNVIRMAVDTLCAKISKAKPKPTFITDGGKFK